MENDNEFKKLMDEICCYYYERGLPMEMLAERIDISKRMLQKWRNKGTRPRERTIQMLACFLQANDGGHFIIRLRNIFGRYSVEQAGPGRGSFPKELGEDDITAIRSNFPGVQEFLFLCAMVVYGDKPAAAEEVIPGGTLAQKAALISSYDTCMARAKAVLGIDGISDWKDKVIRCLVCNPEEDGDLEALGQQALDNIIFGYLQKKGERG